MNLTDKRARALLRARGLRATAPRIAVLCALARNEAPQSSTEVTEQLANRGWDPATIYRNLVKLREAGLAVVASRAAGMDRYALASEHEDGHRHPHFVCDDCGRIACLPAELTDSIVMSGRWSESVANAAIQLSGACPDCRDG